MYHPQLCHKEEYATDRKLLPPPKLDVPVRKYDTQKLYIRNVTQSIYCMKSKLKVSSHYYKIIQSHAMHTLQPIAMHGCLSTKDLNMKKLASLFLIILLVNTAFKCESPAPVEPGDTAATCENSEWLKTIIANAKESGNKGEVIQYQYHGEKVFSINTCVGCADAMTVVLDCAGETKCQFGGIAGFNTCPDFEDKATNKKILWSN